ncbi:hypothetical protein AB0K51_08930 [Kitasatospora sp. NPDC049285]|uniref:hypothetical protein n=1 Tax=Kitasatospora sp. NPDC049285 TaxID=3157096 RepID=UPI00343F734A
MSNYSMRLPVGRPEPVQGFDDLYQLGRDDTGEYAWRILLGELTDLLPIAHNGGSDTLFLDLDPATHGRLHAFVHGVDLLGYLGSRVRKGHRQRSHRPLAAKRQGVAGQEPPGWHAEASAPARSAQPITI